MVRGASGEEGVVVLVRGISMKDNIAKKGGMGKGISQQAV
jgi:hypothetical protein